MNTTRQTKTTTTTAKKAAPAQAAPSPAARASRTWDATTAKTHACAGPCAKKLSARSFPTTGTEGRRGVVCRSCRDAARKATA